MDLKGMFQVSASGLSAQRMRLQVVGSNIANAQSTSGPEGEAYRRRVVVLKAEPVEGSFQGVLNREVAEVQVTEVDEDQRPFQLVYDPGHPHADEEGYVELPNVNLMEEMMDMMMIQRSYEANVSALGATRQMALRALAIGK